MLELRFSGEAAVVRQEMMTLLGIAPLSHEEFLEKLASASAETCVEVAKRLGVDLAGNPLPQPDAPRSGSSEVVERGNLAAETPKTRARRGAKTEEPAAPLADSASAASASSGAASAEPETANAADAPAPTEKTTASTSDVVLDFVKDVRPVLEIYGKLVGPTPLQALIASFGVRRASELTADRFPDLLAAIEAATVKQKG